mgnify:CR=1 FL=1
MGILRADLLTHSQLQPTGSVFFDGTDDKITTTGFGNIGTSDFTLECWVYLSTTAGIQRIISADEGSQSTEYTAIRSNSNHGWQGYIGTDTGWWEGHSGNDHPSWTTGWHHVVLQRFGNDGYIFVDGEYAITDQDGSSASNAADPVTVTTFVLGHGIGSEYLNNGYISNARVSMKAVYGGNNFTVPKFELQSRGDTYLLCCQSSSSSSEAAVAPSAGLTVTGAAASSFHPGLKKDITDTGVVFDGFTVLATSTYMVPPSGKTTERNRGRAAVGGGYDGSSVRNEIEYFNIQSMGIAIDFGNLTTTTFALASNAASSTRGIIAVGGRTPSYVNTIEFITIANTSNATDFGDTSATGGNIATSSNQTRGILMGGRQPTRNTIDLITIATVGNASDFGDLTAAKRQGASLSSPTRAIYAGGFDDTNRINNIEFVTIASTGNATDFGDLTDARQSLGGASDNTRGVFAGGYDAPARVNIIDFITIASAGNASDFGDTASARDESTGTSNNTRGVFAGFNDGGRQNNIYFVTIQTTGNASDFGDLITKRTTVSNCSDSHGGLS